jgi:hypothetical protein
LKVFADLVKVKAHSVISSPAKTEYQFTSKMSLVGVELSA